MFLRELIVVLLSDFTLGDCSGLVKKLFLDDLRIVSDQCHLYLSTPSVMEPGTS